MDLDITAVRKDGDGWVGSGIVLNQQTGELSDIRVAIRLSDQGAEQSTEAILKGTARRVSFSADEVVEASIG